MPCAWDLPLRLASYESFPGQQCAYAGTTHCRAVDTCSIYKMSSPLAKAGAYRSNGKSQIRACSPVHRNLRSRVLEARCAERPISYAPPLLTSKAPGCCPKQDARVQLVEAQRYRELKAQAATPARNDRRAEEQRRALT